MTAPFDRAAFVEWFVAEAGRQVGQPYDNEHRQLASLAADCLERAVRARDDLWQIAPEDYDVLGDPLPWAAAAGQEEKP